MFVPNQLYTIADIVSILISDSMDINDNDR